MRQPHTHQSSPRHRSRMGVLTFSGTLGLAKQGQENPEDGLLVLEATVVQASALEPCRAPTDKPASHQAGFL